MFLVSELGFDCGPPSSLELSDSCDFMAASQVAIRLTTPFSSSGTNPHRDWNIFQYFLSASEGTVTPAIVSRGSGICIKPGKDRFLDNGCPYLKKKNCPIHVQTIRQNQEIETNEEGSIQCYSQKRKRFGDTSKVWLRFKISWRLVHIDKYSLV